MPTTYTNGLKLPDLGSIDWYNAYKNNIDILDPIVGTVNGVATTYAPISHNHDASEITSGTIDIARLPPAALERLTTVADQTARYALTTSTVQLGDTVKQLDTGIMYLVVDTTKLNSADGYVEYSAGTASKAIADEDGTNIKTGYVNVAGNQTVSGQKIWTQAQVFQNNIYLANTSYTVGTIPTSNITSTCFFSGVSNYQIGYCRSVVYKTTGQTSAELTTRNKFTNGALDPNGDYTNATFTVNLDADGTRWIQFANSSIKNGLTPYTTDTYNIGSATNQWLRLFAKFYYYNGVAWGLDQNNIWTGSNTFSSILNQNINSVYSEIPSSDHFAVKGVTDNNGNNVFVISFADRSSGQRDLTLRVYDTNGVSEGVGLYKNSDNSSDFKPMSNALVNLGAPSNQWSSVYAQSYYYNGTAWGLDKANTWGNTQTVTGNDKGWNIINPDIEKGVIPSTNKSSFVWWADKNNNFLGRICSRVHTDGTTMLWLSSLNYYKNGVLDPTGSSATTSLILGVDANAYKFVQTNADFRPDANNTSNLGTSTNKWKTLNGINPGALSLPDASIEVPLDLTNVHMDGTYTYLPVPVNGWLYVALKDTTCKTDGELTFYIGDSGTSSAYAKWATNFVCSTDGYVRCFIPVLANSRIRIRVNPNGGSPTSLSMIIYPCLGNV